MRPAGIGGQSTRELLSGTTLHRLRPRKGADSGAEILRKGANYGAGQSALACIALRESCAELRIRVWPTVALTGDPSRACATLAVESQQLTKSGGHEIRTRNRLPGTTFPVWPLAIRLPSGGRGLHDNGTREKRKGFRVSVAKERIDAKRQQLAEGSAKVAKLDISRPVCCNQSGSVVRTFRATTPMPGG